MEEIPSGLLMPFTKLGLPQEVLDNLAKLGFQKPTPIQEQAIPMLLAGKDLLATSQTGTGKTAAFGCPIVSRLLAGKRTGIRCLILEPTRELAQQVDVAIRTYCAGTPLRVAAFFGGVGYGPQRKALQMGVDIVVATPGRLEDFIQQNHIRLNNVEILVVDEVDRMLDIGFLPAVKRIVQKCPPNRQTAVFSATLQGPIRDIAIGSLRPDHESIAIESKRSVAETIEHAIYSINSEQKFDFLAKLLDTLGHDKLIIFTRTKHGADKVSRNLSRIGHATTELHSNRSQRQREHALAGLKTGKYRVLVATDIAARGIDIRSVSHVINYDVPEQAEDYVHRIGRTGRAEATGDALTLVTNEEERKVVAIEKLLNQTITRKKLEDFPYKTPPRMETGRPSRGDSPRSGGSRGGGGGFKRPARSQDHRGPRPERSDRFEGARPPASRHQEDFRPGRPSGGGGGASSHAAPRSFREGGSAPRPASGQSRPSGGGGSRPSGGSSRPGGSGGFKKSFGKPPRRD